jgi:hypothetical protein
MKNILICLLVIFVAIALAKPYGGGGFRAAPRPVARAGASPAFGGVSSNACAIEAIRRCGGRRSTGATACRAVFIASCSNGSSRRAAVAAPPAPAAPPATHFIGSAPPPYVSAPAPYVSLGFLSNLPGRWVGEGMNMVQLPNFDSPTPSNYRVLVSRTREAFEFDAISGAVANRGSALFLNNFSNGQRDLYYAGVTYFQNVCDYYTGEGLHVEPGLFLNIPATAVNPNHNATVVRMASIPHGDTIHCEANTLLVQPQPSFDPINTTPTGPIASFVTPVTAAQCPQGITPDQVVNPSLYLQQQIAGQNIVNTIVIEVTSQVEGKVSNIPFVKKNANVVSIDAIFWIETVQNPDGSTFLQLQYSQTVNLSFLGSIFPHVSVATLRKQ